MSLKFMGRGRRGAQDLRPLLVYTACFQPELVVVVKISVNLKHIWQQAISIHGCEFAHLKLLDWYKRRGMGVTSPISHM